MTGGVVVVLGTTGRNFGAGMSGGIAYIFDESGAFRHHCNRDMVELGRMDRDDAAEVKEMIERHAQYTGSALARSLLARWSEAARFFVKVMPRDYKRMLQALQDVKRSGPQRARRRSWRHSS